METTPNKYITVAYELYTTDDGQRELIEKATKEHPFQFISGLGVALDAFEEKLAGLEAGERFAFTLTADKAYGEYRDEYVVDVPRSVFEVDGRFDSQRVYAGNVIPLMNADGQRLNGTVVEVKGDVVVMDLNHPLAGSDLTFEGEVVESRPATNEEIQGTLRMLSGEGCGCGCCGGESSCGDGCGSNECGCEGHCH